MTVPARAALVDDLRRADDRLLDLCTGPVRVPSENPPGDTRAIASHVESMLAPLGAHDLEVGVGDVDVEEAGVRDRAAGSQREKPAAATRVEPVVDAIPEDSRRSL